MVKARDITGLKFGRLTAIALHHIKEDTTCKRHFWAFKCDCGKECIIAKHAVTSSHTQSCGCLHKEITSQKNGTHHLANTSIYNVYLTIKARCFNSSNKSFKDYGGRGITVCDEWKNDFKAFYDWAMANGYKEGLSIDRIDVNGNYEPDNCRWSNRKVQARNKRNNHLIEFHNEIKCLMEWCEIYKINRKTVKNRLERGWKLGEALTIPPRKIKGKN